ncbi:WASP homolog-associated protein with actin, membranes and microtubules [Galemys pyrenaicus]|uniref:WASP homolog-associated protein with actin, membranes and microtubules n=1 Tax=Galemys pyrenaicus TaxID=202257 RepID=A0A8J6A8I3_GALPY|nr:WASP homolog-associated protein with actin, membranes and microtubules [Galemys pyrenaicus]
MADEPPDSLDGWVPVREGLFAAPERRALRFLVASNAAEAQFALAALWPPLERCFPAALPPELDAAGRGAWGRGLWALVRPRAGPGEAALQELCAHLERYLGQAADGCGGAAVRDALFPGQGAEGAAADCESPREFRERALGARRAEADARLRQVLQGHEEAGTMVALTALYREEDQAYQYLVATSTAFFQHRLQPLRGSREVAASWKRSILKSLEEEDLGPRRAAALQGEAQEWARRAEEAVAAIQDITVEYFQATMSALAGTR